MISIERQQKLFIDVGKMVNKSTTTYAIGGTAMMFQGHKESTLDIDLVFSDEKERKEFIKAINELGYVKRESFDVYGEKENKPLMFTRGDERFDLFLRKVINFIFSEKMMKRAVQKHQFGKNLIIKIAAPEDIIIMKCATDRVKDLDDAKRIVEMHNVNWDTVIEEALNQVKLGEVRALLDLGYFLENLQKNTDKVPKDVLDRIYELLLKQIKERKK